MLKHCMLWLCSILVLITTGLAAQPQAFAAQASNEKTAAKMPLSLTEIKKLLEGSVSPKRAATLVEQYGVNFELTDDVEKELRELGADGDLLLVISKKRVQPADTTAQEWAAVRYSNDRNRLDAFLQRHPSGSFADVARAQIEQNDWTKANGSNDRSKLQAYLNQHDGGRFEQQAREQIERVDWNSAVNSHDRARIQAYIDRYHDGRYGQQAHEALEQIDWDAVKDSKDVQRLRTFLNAYPQGHYATSAKAAIEAPANVQPPMQAQARPKYCPLPDKLDFDYSTPEREKIGI
jgi:outer membrane protein assembly factor BamD (BamD/ComL family)